MHSSRFVLPWAGLFSHIRSPLLHFLGMHSSHYSGPNWDMSHLGSFILQKTSDGALDAQECVRFTLRVNWISESTTGQLVECVEEKYHEHDFRKTLQFQNNSNASKIYFNIKHERHSPIPEQITHMNRIYWINDTLIQKQMTHLNWIQSLQHNLCSPIDEDDVNQKHRVQAVQVDWWRNWLVWTSSF